MSNYYSSRASVTVGVLINSWNQFVELHFKMQAYWSKNLQYVHANFPGNNWAFSRYDQLLLLVLSGKEVSTLVQSVLNFNPLPPPP
jgi:hypothetical protein